MLTHFNLIDTPGLNDARIPTVDWVGRFNSSESSKPQRLALCIMLFKCSNRPAVSDNNVLAICKTAIKNLDPANTVLIFTHKDQDNEMDEAYAKDWYEIGMTDNEGLPEIPEDRIFLFKGKNDNQGEMTTHEEITTWITSKLPPPEKEAEVKEVNYQEYVEKAAGSSNDATRAAVTRELEMLKALLHD